MNPTDVVRLYHGSSEAIRKPDLAHNTGFADLGKGFYLTDDHVAAKGRARARARREGSAPGVVSSFDFDLSVVRWVYIGDGTDLPSGRGLSRFGLWFLPTDEGLAAWVRYIAQCRSDNTTVGDLGSPEVVRAWIATEEVEMACAGYVSAEEVATAIEPTDLVAQYCLLNQCLMDEALAFVDASPAL